MVTNTWTTYDAMELYCYSPIPSPSPLLFMKFYFLKHLIFGLQYRPDLINGPTSVRLFTNRNDLPFFLSIIPTVVGLFPI